MGCPWKLSLDWIMDGLQIFLSILHVSLHSTTTPPTTNVTTTTTSPIRCKKCKQWKYEYSNARNSFESSLFNYSVNWRTSFDALRSKYPLHWIKIRTSSTCTSCVISTSTSAICSKWICTTNDVSVQLFSSNALKLMRKKGE